MHGFENVGQAGLGQFLLQGGLGRSEDLVEGGLDAVANRAGLVGTLRVRRERLLRFDGLINLRQRYAGWWAAEPGSGARAFASLNESGGLQQQQEPANDDRISVDAPRQQGRRGRLAVLVGENSQHMDCHGKSATGSHALYVTVIVTVVNLLVLPGAWKKAASANLHRCNQS